LIIRITGDLIDGQRQDESLDISLPQWSGRSDWDGRIK
jgi:hypothetical protein